MKNFEKYYQTVEFIQGLNNLGKKSRASDDPEINLKKMNYLLKLIGNPEKNFKYVHITGTAGKGSVSNMLHSVLVTSGKKAGLMTSPHVLTMIERAKVGNLYIDPNEFVKIVDEIKPAINKTYEKDLGVGYTQIIMAIALKYFKQQKCEWVVLEAFSGARYDTSNVIKDPVITAITNVDYDHLGILGYTLDQIAWEKAGIIKKNSHFWTSESRPKILKSFKAIALENKAYFHKIKQRVSSGQEKNKILVQEICDSLQINQNDIRKGIDNSNTMPCRFEIMDQNPQIVLDGAHNYLKLQSTLENLSNLKFKKLYLIITAAQNKDLEIMFKDLIAKSDYIFATRYENPFRSCANPLEILNIVKKYKKSRAKAELEIDPNIAFDKARKLAQKDDLILVTGSFFLTGELRKRWYSEEYVLNKRQSF